jgi:hypothetical protein
MLRRYDRSVRSLANCNSLPFPEISDSFPELQNIKSLRRPGS